ncbi:hypothetical protein FHT70_004868 [Rhizobium sp. BK049]|nr:hypothetical protein [Rhizobium sp. BK049]
MLSISFDLVSSTVPATSVAAIAAPVIRDLEPNSAVAT